MLGVGVVNVTAGEACDDGNNNPGDGCDPLCEFETICLRPSAKAAGPRYISITPDPSATNPVALLVNGVAGDPDVSCVSGSVSPAGLLRPTPTYRTPTEWRTISVRGPELIAGKTYEIMVDCDPSNPGSALSDPVGVTLWELGDADNSGVVDILDITRGIDGFRAVFHSMGCAADADCAGVEPNFECDLGVGMCYRIKLENVDIVGAGDCASPERVISILDIVKAIDEFRSFPSRCLGPCGF